MLPTTHFCDLLKTGVAGENQAVCRPQRCLTEELEEASFTATAAYTGCPKWRVTFGDYMGLKR